MQPIRRDLMPNGISKPDSGWTTAKADYVGWDLGRRPNAPCQPTNFGRCPESLDPSNLNQE